MLVPNFLEAALIMRGCAALPAELEALEDAEEPNEGAPPPSGDDTMRTPS